MKKISMISKAGRIIANLLFFVGITSYAQLHDISRDVAYVDADRFVLLNDNACIVKKGDKYALINMKGEFLIPYGKYIYLDNQSTLGESTVRHSNNKLMKVFDPASNKFLGFINGKGEMVLPEKNKDNKGESFNQLYNYRILTYNAYRTGYYDKNGNPLTALTQITRFVKDSNVEYELLLDDFNTYTDCMYKPCDLEIIPAKQSKTIKDNKKAVGFTYQEIKYGAFSPDGKIAVPFEYEERLDISNGMICAAKKDEFGVLKYGFVDKNGKILIPFQFTVRPGNFHEGLALVKPKNNADFDYAYINKQGESMIKFGAGNTDPLYLPLNELGDLPWKNHPEQPYHLRRGGFFLNGYAMWRERKSGKMVFLDKNGAFHSLEEMIGSDLRKDNSAFDFQRLTENGFYFRTSSKIMSENDQGFIDYQKNLIFPPIFESLFADPNGDYALASMILPDTPKKRNNSITGIVNKRGEFIILLKEKDLW